MVVGTHVLHFCLLWFKEWGQAWSLGHMFYIFAYCGLRNGAKHGRWDTCFAFLLIVV